MEKQVIIDARVLSFIVLEHGDTKGERAADDEALRCLAFKNVLQSNAMSLS